MTNSSHWEICLLRKPNQQWNRHCSYCGIVLLTGERHGGFCCGPSGKYATSVPRLPDIPEEFEWLSQQPNISALSCKLNLLFSFAAMETTEDFPVHVGPQGFLAIQGCVYHR
ncbi:hypothetical protein M422DRAFT_183943, partial [Sphaerobolus stellatus SS14]